MRKLSVCGKGGSGKSTVVALLSDQMRARGYSILVVDSDDSNPGLFRTLGFERRPVPLLELVGGKKNVFQTFSKAASPSQSVLAQDEIEVDDLPGQYVEELDGIKLVCIGKILQSLEGCACPMGALNREFLKRLRLSDEEIAIIDMEAGIEHFGRGVEVSVDDVLVVVDPSYDSIELAEKIQTLASGVGANDIGAVLNKIPTEEIGAKVTLELRERGVNVVGTIGYDEDISSRSLEGRSLRGDIAAEQTAGIVDLLLQGEGLLRS